ncbi:MAG: hypothetical protein ABIC95_03405 [archaeon]
MKRPFNLEEEKRALVLARFRTLNPNAKLRLGEHGEISVSELLNHVDKRDDFGKKIVEVQMHMLKTLAGAR